MSPLKQIFLGSAVGLVLGLIIAMPLKHYEIIDPPPSYETAKPSKQKKIIVWSGTIGGQEIEITQKEIESY